MKGISLFPGGVRGESIPHQYKTIPPLALGRKEATCGVPVAGSWCDLVVMAIETRSGAQGWVDLVETKAVRPK